MVDRILLSIIGALIFCNIVQFTLLDRCKVKLAVQNEMVIIANEQRDAFIKERDKKAEALAKDYQRKIELIKHRPVGEGEYSCEQSLDLIVSAMKEISNEPDNP